MSQMKGLPAAMLVSCLPVRVKRSCQTSTVEDGCNVARGPISILLIRSVFHSNRDRVSRCVQCSRPLAEGHPVRPHHATIGSRRTGRRTSTRSVRLISHTPAASLTGSTSSLTARWPRAQVVVSPTDLVTLRHLVTLSASCAWHVFLWVRLRTLRCARSFHLACCARASLLPLHLTRAFSRSSVQVTAFKRPMARLREMGSKVSAAYRTYAPRRALLHACALTFVSHAPSPPRLVPSRSCPWLRSLSTCRAQTQIPAAD